MNANVPSGLSHTHAVGRLSEHLVAIVVGLVLMVMGLALGVTIVLLPLGIPVGLAGTLLFLWGLALSQAPARPRRP